MALTKASADVIADGSITAEKLAAGVLTADSTGRAKMADGFTTTAKIADGALSADATGRGKMADGFVNQSKMAAGVGATGPAFSAYRSTSQSATSGSTLKIQFDTEDFDTAAAYDNATNYRFNPQVAGYYQITARVAAVASTAANNIIAMIYKNGAAHRNGIIWYSPGGLQGMAASVSALVYLNGSSDYIEIFATPVGTGTVTIAGVAASTFFQGALVRAG